MSGFTFLNEQLSRRSSIFGLHLWVVLGICVGASIVIGLFLISLWFTSRRNNTSTSASKATSKATQHHPTIPNVSKEIQEIRIDCSQATLPDPKPDPVAESDPLPRAQAVLLQPEEESLASTGRQRIHIEIGKDHRISYPEKGDGSSDGSGETRSRDQGAITVPEVSHLGWGHWYTLRELEDATNGFADENVIDEGGYEIVYRGVLEDNSMAAVKNLLNNKGQAEKEFKVEVEAIGRVRHKNLVRLLGYCAEGAHRYCGIAPTILAGRIDRVLFEALCASQHAIFLCSKIPQIWQNFSNKSTGELSFLTNFMNFGGSMVRVFTSIQEQAPKSGILDP